MSLLRDMGGVLEIYTQVTRRGPLQVWGITPGFWEKPFSWARFQGGSLKPIILIRGKTLLTF